MNYNLDNYISCIRPSHNYKIDPIIFKKKKIRNIY